MKRDIDFCLNINQSLLYSSFNSNAKYGPPAAFGEQTTAWLWQFSAHCSCSCSLPGTCGENVMLCLWFNRAFLFLYINFWYLNSCGMKYSICSTCIKIVLHTCTCTYKDSSIHQLQSILLHGSITILHPNQWKMMAFKFLSFCKFSWNL